MKDLQKMGGLAALYEAAAYVLGIVFFFFVVDYAGVVDPVQKVVLLANNQAAMTIMNLIIYVVFGVVLVVLALALYERLKAGSPAMGQAATIFGLTWAVLVFASGFITLYGWEVIANLYRSDPTQAATLKLMLDTVTIGLDHSDRFLGCLWVLLASWAALRAGMLPKALNYLGLSIGIPGIISTAFPALTELGIAFGLGIILWWIWLGIAMLGSRPSLVVEKASEVETSNPTLSFAGK